MDRLGWDVVIGRLSDIWNCGTILAIDFDLRLHLHLSHRRVIWVILNRGAGFLWPHEHAVHQLRAGPRGLAALSVDIRPVIVAHAGRYRLRARHSRGGEGPTCQAGIVAAAPDNAALVGG